MAHRIELFTIVNDTKSAVMQQKLLARGFKIKTAKVVETYIINRDFTNNNLQKIASILANPVTQKYLIDDYTKDIDFDFALEIGFLPGVTDNIANTARESVEDLFKIKFKEGESVHSSTLIFLKGTIKKSDTEKIAESLSNPLIQRTTIKSHAEFAEERGMDSIVPKVKLKSSQKTDEVEINLPDKDLLKLGKEGIPNTDGSRRGPLALDLDYLHAIQKYYKKLRRNPTDIELESLAQTWSEHCKHTIFAAKIDNIKEGLYRGYIKKATEEIRKAKGKKDFCVSVFKDNSGGILFDDNWVITDKAETHNTPSALEPFGGAITGIVGVNRDCIGFGKGAKPIINKYGFCVGLPDDKEQIYRDPKRKIKALGPGRVLEGVVEGVNAGGNQSGIPTPQGFVHFHKDYKGKPLIFVGTVGLIPRKINGKPGHEKQARPGDKIVVIGGRVGQDGIHGATFSSEALTAGSPSTAVQIGDPITQKKLSDAVVKEARDKELYNSITDCGAGGISCSVAEMAKESGGCLVQLEKVPLKYPNLEPWKIWISESQERMTLAVPPKKLAAFQKVMEKHGVESTVIGEFTNSGRCTVTHHGATIMDLEMDFLHEGLPKKTLHSTYKNQPNKSHGEPSLSRASRGEPLLSCHGEPVEPSNPTQTLLEILQRPNICSYEFISTQYDHTVQGGSVLQPLQGKGKVNSPTSITKPFPESKKGIVLSQGINPAYSFIDTYHMAACAIDTAIRNIIAAGGTLNHLALMDNFCWCSANEPQRLGELKAAVQACYDYATKYGTPYISGKDSMFNDFQGFNEEGKAIKISAPPTLLISSISVIDDITKAVSIDPKFPGDLIYILGETREEVGGSEYLASQNLIGNSVPQVNAKTAIKLYRKLEEAIGQRLISSCLSPSFGGLAVALAKKAIAGNLGMEIDFGKLPFRTDFFLFSESQSRFIVTIAPKNKLKFEKLFKGLPQKQIGTVTDNQKFIIKNLIFTDIQTLNENYKKTFKNL